MQGVINAMVATEPTCAQNALWWVERSPFLDTEAVAVIKTLCLDHNAVMLQPEHEDILEVAEVSSAQTFVVPSSTRLSESSLGLVMQIMCGLLPNAVRKYSRVVIVSPFEPPKNWSGTRVV